MKKLQFDAATVLRGVGLKATPRRIQLLTCIAVSGRPLSVAMIHTELGDIIDAVTVYRALETFCRVGIVRRVDFGHGRAYYEIKDTHDHHHIICTVCAQVEDFSGCEAPRIVRNAIKNSKQFSTITRHSLELFGVCKVCSAR